MTYARNDFDDVFTRIYSEPNFLREHVPETLNLAEVGGSGFDTPVTEERVNACSLVFGFGPIPSFSLNHLRRVGDNIIHLRITGTNIKALLFIFRY